MGPVSLQAIGVVHNGVTQARDEGWGGVVSEIHLEPDLADGLLELQHFSHVVVVFLMHEARFDPAVHLTRHPRDRADLPLVGIFAQRARHTGPAPTASRPCASRACSAEP